MSSTGAAGASGGANPPLGHDVRDCVQKVPGYCRVEGSSLRGLGVAGFAHRVMMKSFSRPTARILCARHAVIRPLDGQSPLMLQAVNEQHNVILKAQASLMRHGYRRGPIERIPHLAAIERFHELPGLIRALAA